MRKGDKTYDRIGEIPEQLRARMLAVRSFDAKGMMRGAALADGRELEDTIGKLFTDLRAEYLHVHFAAPGCYAARVDRA